MYLLFLIQKVVLGADMPWGNGIAALRWNHLFTNKLFMNVTATVSDYMFQFGSAQDQFDLICYPV